jgi:5S rRNA maturation endonuclease (ribonuclease M5)
LNRKDLYLRDEFINWLKQLKVELLEHDTLLLVEGKNDKAFFSQLGFEGKKILQISYLTTEKLLEKIEEIVSTDQVVCIPLVDFDREGKNLLNRIKNLNSIKASENELFKKIKIDNYFRKKLSLLLMGRYREIEDLRYYAKKMQISRGDV